MHYILILCLNICFTYLGTYTKLLSHMCSRALGALNTSRKKWEIRLAWAKKPGSGPLRPFLIRTTHKTYPRARQPWCSPDTRAPGVALITRSSHWAQGSTCHPAAPSAPEMAELPARLRRGRGEVVAPADDAWRLILARLPRSRVRSRLDPPSLWNTYWSVVVGREGRRKLPHPFLAGVANWGAWLAKDLHSALRSEIDAAAESIGARIKRNSSPRWVTAVATLHRGRRRRGETGVIIPSLA
jgi:hypothetical protein